VFLLFDQVICVSELCLWFMHDVGSIQRSHHNTAWQPWEQTDHSSVWLLWWMFAKIWKCQCVEIFYWSVWLPATDSTSWWTGFTLLFYLKMWNALNIESDV